MYYFILTEKCDNDFYARQKHVATHVTWQSHFLPHNEQHYLVGAYMLGKGKCTPPTNVESFERSPFMCYDWSPYYHFELLSSLAENIPNAVNNIKLNFFKKKIVKGIPLHKIPFSSWYGHVWQDKSVLFRSLNLVYVIFWH